MVSLKSGELAKQAHVNVETLRYYEREGLLPTPERSASGYRLYQDADVKRVSFIKKAQTLGFTLTEIKTLLALTGDGHQTAGNVKTLTEQKITLIEEKIQALLTMKATLLELVEACPGSEGTVDASPIIHCLASAE
jgi:MerR family transcriptional regulator, copper efflux regulator